MLWVVKDSRMTGKPSVASMNLNGSFSRTMNKTVKAVCVKRMEHDSDTVDE